MSTAKVPDGFSFVGESAIKKVSMRLPYGRSAFDTLPM